MSAHAPKTAALLALEGELLSEAGRARLQRHLDACAVCRRQRETMRRYAALVQNVSELPIPEIDLARVERQALEATRPRRGRRLMAVLAAAVVAGGGLLWLSQPAAAPAPERAEAPAPTPPPTLAEPPPGAMLARVTALSGTVRASHPEHASMDVTLARPLWSGWTVHTAPGSRVDLRLWDGTGVSLQGQSRLALGQLDGERIALSLRYGEVSARVRRPDSEARFSVAAGAYRVEVTGTWFSLRHVRAGVSVDLREGELEVRLEEGTTVATLVAPARWHQYGEEAGAAARPPPSRPFALQAAWDSLGGLRLPVAAGIARWEVDGEPLLASAGVRLRLPRGEAEVVAVRPDGRRMRAAVQVGGDPLGTRFDPATLELEPLKAKLPAQPGPGLEAEELAGVVARGRGALQRCYDLELKRRPDARPQLSLRIRLSPGGQVQAVRPRPKEAASASLAQCLRGVVEGWDFPAPGTSVTFDAPLRFQPGR